MVLVADPERRSRLIEIAAPLPEASHAESGRESEHITFKVRKKTFAYYLNDHHGDGRIALECKATPGMQDMLVASDPVRFYVPPYLGSSGWIGLRLDLDEVDWDEVEMFLTESYRMQAPKGLAALLDPPAR